MSLTLALAGLSLGSEALKYGNGRHSYKTKKVERDLAYLDLATAREHRLTRQADAQIAQARQQRHAAPPPLPRTRQPAQQRALPPLRAPTQQRATRAPSNGYQAPSAHRAPPPLRLEAPPRPAKRPRAQTFSAPSHSASSRSHTSASHSQSHGSTPRSSASRSGTTYTVPASTRVTTITLPKKKAVQVIYV